MGGTLRTHRCSLDHAQVVRVEKRTNGQAIPETCASKRYLRTSLYLRGPGRPTIYTVKQQHISAAEQKSKETIQKTRETNENKVTYLINQLSSNMREKANRVSLTRRVENRH